MPESPAGLPQGPPRNIALAYRAMAAAVRDGTAFGPGFDHARRLHDILDAMDKSSAEGHAVPLGPTAP